MFPRYPKCILSILVLNQINLVIVHHCTLYILETPIKPLFWLGLSGASFGIASPNQTRLGSSRLAIDIPHRCLFFGRLRYSHKFHIGKSWKTNDNYGKLMTMPKYCSWNWSVTHLLNTNLEWLSENLRRCSYACKRLRWFCLLPIHLLVRMRSHRCFILYRCLNIGNEGRFFTKVNDPESQICNKAIWKIQQNEGSTVAVVTAWFSFWVDIIWCPWSCRLPLESGEETPLLRLVQWEDVPQAGKTTLQSQHVLVIKFCHTSTNYYVMGGVVSLNMVSIVTSCHTTVLGYVEC